MNFKNMFVGITIVAGITACTVYFLYDYFYENQRFATQIILTIIDDSEPSSYRNEINPNGVLKRGSLGPCATKLLAALLEEQCIIIVSSSVVKHLMHYLETFDLKDNPFNLAPAKKIEPCNWIKKRVSEYLYVLIPKNYIERRHNYSELKRLDLKSTGYAYSLEELVVGIPFTSWNDIDNNAFIDSTYHKGIQDYPEKLVERRPLESADGMIAYVERNRSWLSDHFIQHLGRLFITRAEYKDVSNFMPRSVIIAEGHGSNYCSFEAIIKELQEHGDQFYKEQERLHALKAEGQRVYYGGSLSGLSSKDFGCFLGFLAEHLKIKLFVFCTCYGAEINIQEALRYIKKGQQVSFPLISGALSNAPSTSGTVKRESWDRRDSRNIRVSLQKPIFKKFFDALNICEDPSNECFLTALEYIYSCSKQGDESYNNIPSLKLPGELWSVFEKPHILVLNDAVLEKKLLEDNRLDIAVLFNDKRGRFTLYNNLCGIHDRYSREDKDPFIVLVAPSKISCEIVFSDTMEFNVPAFISMIPGDAQHHFKKINASPFILSSFLKAFFTIPDLQEQKTFIIDELIVQNDTSVLPKMYEIIVLKNVIITNTPAMNNYDAYSLKTVSFECDGIQWGVVVEKDVPISKSIKKVHIDK